MISFHAAAAAAARGSSESGMSLGSANGGQRIRRQGCCGCMSAFSPFVTSVDFPFSRSVHSILQVINPPVGAFVKSIIHLCSAANDPLVALFNRPSTHPSIHPSIYPSTHLIIPPKCSCALCLFVSFQGRRRGYHPSSI